MQAAGFMSYCPYELGDLVEVTLVDGMAITGYPRKASTALMTITDILTVHSVKRGTVTFLYELDGKKQMQLIPWQKLTGGTRTWKHKGL